MRKLTICMLLWLSVSIILSSCIFPSDPPSYAYRGDHKGLYTAANYSILGMRTGSEDKVIVLTTDSYGRTLYFLKTNTWIKQDKYIAAILVSQSNSDSDVSYYVENNVSYIYTDRFDVTEESCYSFFTKEAISELKEKNDWEKPLDLSKATIKNICTSDYDLNFAPKNKIKNAITDIFGKDNDNNIFYDPIIQCSNGGSAYLVGSPRYKSGDNIDNSNNDFYFVVFYNKGEKFIYEKIADIHNCDKQLHQLLNKR